MRVESVYENGEVLEINSEMGGRTEKLSRYDANEVPRTTNCYLENPKINSENDMIDQATVIDGAYEFYTEYPKRGVQVRATRLTFEATGKIHCKIEGKEKNNIKEMGIGKIAVVQYHSNEIPSPTGILSCGGTPLFQSKKVTLANGEVIEHIRQELIQAPIID